MRAPVTQSRVHTALVETHEKLVAMGLTGNLPRLNMHADHHLPPCVYQPNTNAVAACIQKMAVRSDEQLFDAVRDAMAMCGCYRQYQYDMRVWNASQNKARLQVPALAMHGGPKWRSIRSKL